MKEICNLCEGSGLIKTTDPVVLDIVWMKCNSCDGVGMIIKTDDQKNLSEL